MNARKIILTLGGIVVVSLIALIAYAILAHQKFEKEANTERTAKARAARHSKPEPIQEQPEAGTQSETVENQEQEID